MKTEVTHELVKVLKEELMNKGSVSIPSIGTFGVEHRRQHRVEYADGRIVLEPPKDVIVFSPDT